MVGTRPERLSTFLKAVAQALARRLCNHCCKMRKVSAGGTATLQTWLCTMLLSMCTCRSDATALSTENCPIINSRLSIAHLQALFLARHEVGHQAGQIKDSRRPFGQNHPLVIGNISQSLNSIPTGLQAGMDMQLLVPALCTSSQSDGPH